MSRFFFILGILFFTAHVFSQGFQISDYNFIGEYANEWDSCEIRVKKNQEDQMSLLVEIYPYKDQTKNCAYFIIAPDFVDAFVSNVAMAFEEYQKLLTSAHNTPMKNYRRQLELIPCKAKLLYKPFEADFAYQKDVDILFKLKVEEVVNVYLDIEADKSFYEKTNLPWNVNYVVIRLDFKTLPRFTAILKKDRIEEYKKK